MTTTKPIDLIVANLMHRALTVVKESEVLIGILKKFGAQADAKDINAEIARKLLCEIAYDAHISKVYMALKSVGAPSSAEDIAEGLKAVKERQT